MDSTSVTVGDAPAENAGAAQLRSNATSAWAADLSVKARCSRDMGGLSSGVVPSGLFALEPANERIGNLQTPSVNRQ